MQSASVRSRDSADESVSSRSRASVETYYRTVAPLYDRVRVAVAPAE